jgi:hypothetical protein
MMKHIYTSMTQIIIGLYTLNNSLDVLLFQ